MLRGRGELRIGFEERGMGCDSLAFGIGKGIKEGNNCALLRAASFGWLGFAEPLPHFCRRYATGALYTELKRKHIESKHLLGQENFDAECALDSRYFGMRFPTRSMLNSSSGRKEVDRGKRNLILHSPTIQFSMYPMMNLIARTRPKEKNQCANHNPSHP